MKFYLYLFKNAKAVAVTVFNWESLRLWNVNIMISEHLYWRFRAGWYWFPSPPEEKVNVHRSGAAICDALKWWSWCIFSQGCWKDRFTCRTRVRVSMPYNSYLFPVTWICKILLYLFHAPLSCLLSLGRAAGGSSREEEPSSPPWFSSLTERLFLENRLTRFKMSLN